MTGSKVFTFAVGAYRCALLFDSVLLVKPDQVLPPERQSDWPALALDGEGRLVTPVFCLLIDTGAERVLIDVGNGERPDRPPETQGTLPERLRDIGIEATDVDAVVLTHSHLDHVGGLVTGRSTGPRPWYARATHFITRPEWQYVVDPPSDRLPPMARTAHLARLSLAAVREAGKLVIVDPGAEVAPGIRMVHAPGHTPGNVVVEIRSEGASAVFLGDTFHHPGQIADPGLVSINDHARDLVPRTRRAIIERAIAGSALIAAAHFAFPSVGRLDGTAEHATFVPLTGDTIAK